MACWQAMAVPKSSKKNHHFFWVDDHVLHMIFGHDIRTLPDSYPVTCSIHVDFVLFPSILPGGHVPRPVLSLLVTCLGS